MLVNLLEEFAEFWIEKSLGKLEKLKGVFCLWGGLNW